MIDNQTLSDFSRGFYGYGTYDAPFWFVGMEEGGGNSERDISARLQAWIARGCRELEDVAEYHQAIGITKHWTEVPVLQPTWARLIRIVLSYRVGTTSTEQVREYQRSRLGRPNGETCLIELLPLPSPGTNRWLYGDLSSVPELQARETYVRSFSAWRAEHIRSRLSEHKPAFVIFYGMKYMSSWEAISQMALKRAAGRDFHTASQGGTTFIAAKHPAAHGASNEYFHSIGQWMATAG